MNQNFAAVIAGGTGQVGGATGEELLAIPQCREVVMVTRKPIAPRSRIRNVVLDTGAADFAQSSLRHIRKQRCPGYSLGAFARRPFGWNTTCREFTHTGSASHIEIAWFTASK